MANAIDDGWRWADPRWEQRVSRDSTLALAVEALRRTVDLRDAAAAGAEHLTARALLLNAVVNALYARLVEERAASLGVRVEAPNGTGAEIVEKLTALGLLSVDEYRSAPTT